MQPQTLKESTIQIPFLFTTKSVFLCCAVAIYKPAVKHNLKLGADRFAVTCDDNAIWAINKSEIMLS